MSQSRIYKLMYGTDSFVDTELSEATNNVASLRAELGASSTDTFNVNMVVANDATPIQPGDHVAIVSSNKRGG